MRISAAFPSDYLKAADLQDRTIRVTMSHIKLEQIGQGDKQETKPVLYFQGKEKGLVLNKTNANTIAAVYGDDTDNWEGAEIDLFPAMVDFQGKSVAAIRVKVPPIQRQRAAPLNPQPPAGTTVSERNPPPSDDVPF